MCLNATVKNYLSEQKNVPTNTTIRMLFIKILSHNNKELMFSLLIHYLLSVEKDFPFAAYNSVVYYFITRAELIASSVRICLICNQSEIDSHDRIFFDFFF